MTSAKRHLKLGELRAVVVGELREKRRERAVDEVHDARPRVRRACRLWE